MAFLSTLDPDLRQELRASLEALMGVERVVVDNESDAVWIICQPTSERVPLDIAARNALTALGINPLEVPVEVAVRSGPQERRRVRFDHVERSSGKEGMLRVRVVLEWKGQTFSGEAEGERGDTIELRTAATASLRALETLTGTHLGLRLIGVKRVRAFDADLIVASIHVPGEASQRFVGTVLVTSDPLRGAAVAVLNALNRMLGNFLATAD